jgi:hypothetical protein
MCAMRAMFRIFEPSVDALHDAYRAPIADVLHDTIRNFVLYIRSPLSMTPKGGGWIQGNATNAAG